MFLEIVPLPGDNAGELTTKPAEATVGLDQLFQDCAAHLRVRPKMN